LWGGTSRPANWRRRWPGRRLRWCWSVTLTPSPTTAPAPTGPSRPRGMWMPGWWCTTRRLHRRPERAAGQRSLQAGPPCRLRAVPAARGGGGGGRGDRQGAGGPHRRRAVAVRPCRGGRHAAPGASVAGGASRSPPCPSANFKLCFHSSEPFAGGCGLGATSAVGHLEPR
jgi:hypothetical protein